MNTHEMLKSIQENSHQISENVERLIQHSNELAEENDCLKDVLHNFAFWFNKTYPDPKGNIQHPHSVAMRVLLNYNQQT
jgi:hypothetical protein